MVAEVVTTVRKVAEGADREALAHEEEAVQVASQWAQEKLDNFLLEVENSANNDKLLKISYIISRRSSIDVFSSKSSDIGEFVTKIIQKIGDGKIMEGLSGLAGTAINKLLGSASGSAQTERLYDITFDELGGLNRLDAFFFCYRFASSGITNFNKAVIGICIVRSAALMVDDNAYRVVLTSSATLPDASRAAIAKCMVDVASVQKVAVGEDGKPVEVASSLMKARAELAAAIGEGVAHSEQYIARKKTTPFKVGNSEGSAQSQAGALATSTSTLIQGRTEEEELDEEIKLEEKKQELEEKKKELDEKKKAREEKKKLEASTKPETVKTIQS